MLTLNFDGGYIHGGCVFGVAFGDCVVYMYASGYINAHQVGATVSEAVVGAYVLLTQPLDFAPGERVLCQRSSGEWCHAKV